MQLTVIGVNHQTAPLSIREKLAFAAAELPDAVGSLIDSDAALEAVILSTCNRSEIYAVGGDRARLQRHRTPRLPRCLRPGQHGAGRTANPRSN